MEVLIRPPLRTRKLPAMTPAPKLALAALVSVVAFCGVRGHASSFATTSSGLGATSRPVVSCGTSLTVAYTSSFDRGIAAYAVDGIELSSIPAGCSGKTVSVTFYESDDRADGSTVRATLPATGSARYVAVDPSSDPIDAGRVGGVSVVVS
jgi:hypothetical protein